MARRGGLLAADGGAGVVILGNADAVGVVAGGEGALVALPTRSCLERGGDVASHSAFPDAMPVLFRASSTPWGSW